METNVYFSDIHNHIIREIKQARHDITIAVAWFTDVEIFRALCRKAAENVPVKLALLDNEINRSARGLNFQQLTECGGELFWIPENDSGNTMQHKFCVLDSQNVITGSYNWCRSACDNNEDIVIINDANEFALQYLETFNQILKDHGYPVKAAPRLDNEAIVRRLELIRNLLSLGDFDDVRSQVQKLRLAGRNEALQTIINLLDQQQFSGVDQLIADFIMRLRALSIYRDPSIDSLKQQLLTLEFQLNSVSDQKTEVERVINDFLHQHHQRLGTLIKQYLKIHQLLAKQRVDDLLTDAEEDELTSDDIEQAKDEYLDAKEEYEEYCEQFDEIAQKPAPPRLNEADQAELKFLYTKASMLCHPDRVSNEHKEDAHTMFLQLQNAYRNHDLEQVRSLLKSLEQGKFFTDLAASLSEEQQLQRAIAELQHNLQQLRTQLNGLMTSETWITLSGIGDWNRYFTDKQSQLEKEIAELEVAVSSQYE